MTKSITATESILRSGGHDLGDRAASGTPCRVERLQQLADLGEQCTVIADAHCRSLAVLSSLDRAAVSSRRDCLRWQPSFAAVPGQASWPSPSREGRSAAASRCRQQAASRRHPVAVVKLAHLVRASGLAERPLSAPQASAGNGRHQRHRRRQEQDVGLGGPSGCAAAAARSGQP